MMRRLFLILIFSISVLALEPIFCNKNVSGIPYDQLRRRSEDALTGAAESQFRRERDPSIPVPPDTPGRERLLRDLQLAEVRVEVQQSVMELFSPYEKSLLKRSRVMDGLNTDTYDTAHRRLEQIKNSTLYVKFNEKSAEVIVHLLRQVMIDMKAIPMTRTLLENVELKNVGGWGTGFKGLSLQANQLMARVNGIIIDEIRQVEDIRQLLAAAVVTKPGFAYEYGNWEIRTNATSEWLACLDDPDVQEY